MNIAQPFSARRGAESAPAVVSVTWTREELCWIALLCACPAVELASYFLYPSGWARLYFINAGQTLASLLCWLQVRRLDRRGVGEAAPKRFWHAMALGSLAWFLGNLTFMTLEICLGLERYPGWQDLLFFPAYLAIFVALVRIPHPPAKDSALSNSLIEAAGMLVATLLVGWQFRLHEAALNFLEAPSLSTGYPLIYPLFDVVLLWMLSVRARNQERSGFGVSTFVWLIGGLFALIMADFSMPDILVKAPLQAGGSLSDMGWGFFSTMWGLAALEHQRRRRMSPVADSRQPFASREVMILFVNSSWVLGMVVLVLFGLFTEGTGRQPQVLAVGVVAVLALVIARQVRESLSNERLNLLVTELEVSRGQFRQLFQLFPDAALLSQLDDGVFVEVNEGFSRIYGYAYDEVVGRSGLDMGLWAEPGDRPAFVQELRRTGRVNQREGMARHKDGTVIPVEMSARLVEFGGRQYLLNLVRDLREKKAAEELLRRNEIELRRAQKLEAIGGLAGGIAHDLNNMLTPIMGGTELTLMNLPGDHEARPDLETVLEASRRARGLVRQILTFSRRTETQAQVVAPSPIIDEVLSQIRRQLPPSVRLSHLRRSPPSIIGDATQLHQVLLNLCTNAAHALKNMDDGTIEVIEESFEAVLSPDSPSADFRPGHYLHLSVRDTGCGMTPAVMERIFEPFYTTRKAGEGTGLGLAVVHGIVKQHAGVLKVYSSPGEGSVFHVFLPAASADAVPQAHPSGGELPSGSEQEIVCIDDDSLVLEILVSLVRKMGYQARPFGQASAAEAYLTGPDSAAAAAVICDFAMPDIDGITLAQRVGRRRSYLPWILLSGYLSEDTLQRARAAGLEYFIDKPPSVEQIARMLSRVLATPGAREVSRHASAAPVV